MSSHEVLLILILSKRHLGFQRIEWQSQLDPFSHVTVEVRLEAFVESEAYTVTRELIRLVSLLLSTDEET